ncbi:MarR family winged helix-turn-helix transcriptional regulator [Andreprevotia chitinilytica]|uniref:MarR family winged helix-turn-helix transcriptional regulator n=1 Tax=Andreprevotia chitinilytica TaxID=396808 RepID=UPI00068CDC0E|nr:MarR family transcriptional regulator [Andreprevotia chitinilytica]
MRFEQRLDRYLTHYPAAPREVIRASRLMFRGAHLLQARIEAALAPFELEMRHYLALAIITTDEDEAITPSDLSTSLDATRTQITRLLDGLEKRGLVERRLSQTDRRSLDLTLTAAGSALLKAATPVVHDAYREAWSALEADVLQNTLNGLSCLNAALGAEQEPEPK